MRPNPSDCCLSEEAECCPECWTVEIPEDGCGLMAGKYFLEKYFEADGVCGYITGDIGAHPSMALAVHTTTSPRRYDLVFGTCDIAYEYEVRNCVQTAELSLYAISNECICSPPEIIKLIDGCCGCCMMSTVPQALQVEITGATGPMAALNGLHELPRVNCAESCSYQVIYPGLGGIFVGLDDVFRSVSVSVAGSWAEYYTEVSATAGVQCGDSVEVPLSIVHEGSGQPEFVLISGL